MRQPLSSRRAARAARSPGLATPRRQVGRRRLPLHRRMLLARSALLYWVAVVLLALLTAGFMSRLMERAGAAERRFGPVRRVLVSRTSLHAGQHLTRGNTGVEARPVAQLPTGVLDRIPEGAAVDAPVAQGEILTRSRLQAGSPEQPSGTAVIAVPVGEAPLVVRPGDHVDVYATYDPALTPPGADATSRVAARADVVRVTRGSIAVRVGEPEAPALAGAVARASVTVALVQ